MFFFVLNLLMCKLHGLIFEYSLVVFETNLTLSWCFLCIVQRAKNPGWIDSLLEVKISMFWYKPNTGATVLLGIKLLPAGSLTEQGNWKQRLLKRGRPGPACLSCLVWANLKQYSSHLAPLFNCGGRLLELPPQDAVFWLFNQTLILIVLWRYFADGISGS